MTSGKIVQQQVHFWWRLVTKHYLDSMRWVLVEMTFRKQIGVNCNAGKVTSWILLSRWLSQKLPGFGGIWISLNPGNRPKIVFQEMLQKKINLQNFWDSCTNCCSSIAKKRSSQLQFGSRLDPLNGFNGSDFFRLEKHPAMRKGCHTSGPP